MLKRIARLAAHRSGTFRLVQRLNENGVRILMYHRFPREHAGNFAEQCTFLADNYDVVPLTEAIRRLEQGRPAKNLAVISIDDGYADVFENAYPTLKQHGLPATLFVTTGFVERTCWMPGDHVRFFCKHPQQEALTFTDETGAHHQFRSEERQAGDRLRTLLKRVSNRTRTEVLSALTAQEQAQGVFTIPKEYEPCSWDQLREMARNGVSLGAHTVTHPILSRVETEGETEHEIVDSKTVLEREIGAEVETFAYPNGGLDDINRRSVDCVRRNFRGAVTAMFGMNTAPADLHQLLRLPCDPDLSVPSLARMMAGPVRRRPAAAKRLRPA